MEVLQTVPKLSRLRRETFTLLTTLTLFFTYFTPSLCVWCICHPLTNVAVLPCPSLVTLTLPVLADTVLGAEGMAGLLVTHSSCPALLAATHTAITHSVGPAVYLTHFCKRNIHICDLKMSKHKMHFGEFGVF